MNQQQEPAVQDAHQHILSADTTANNKGKTQTNPSPLSHIWHLATDVHMSGRNVDNALLKIHGLLGDEEKQQEEKLKIVKCWRCGERNAPISKFCHKCGLPLDLKAAMKAEEERSKVDRRMTRLLEDPDVQDFLLQKLKQMDATL